VKGVNPRCAFGAGVLTSFGLHALAVAGLSTLPRPAAASLPEFVEVSIAEPTLVPQPDLVPEPDSEHDDAAPPLPTRSVSAAAPQRAVQPKSAPPASLPESTAEPLDLTGTTLTAEKGAWAAQPGNGRASRGPIRLGRHRSGQRAPRTETKAKPTRSGRASSTVSAASLASLPRAPNLNAALARHYPPAAHARGIGGDAVVRVGMGPDGHVTSVVVISESFPGFGAACRATVLGSVWSAPLDASGQAVATVVRYRCRFRVES
jgi:periplasmic protein TonB